MTTINDDIFSRSRLPCEEEYQPQNTEDIVRPSVKRHKLGTTTITNKVSDAKEDIGIIIVLLPTYLV